MKISTEIISAYRIVGVEKAAEMIKALGSRLQSRHIHDNDQWNDLHQIPFSGKVDFVPIVKALKEIRYDGDFTLESSAFLRDYNEDNILEGAKKLAESAKKLVRMFEEVS